MADLKIAKVKVKRNDETIGEYNLKIDLEDSIVAEEDNVTLRLATEKDIKTLFKNRDKIG